MATSCISMPATISVMDHRRPVDDFVPDLVSGLASTKTQASPDLTMYIEASV